MSLIHTINGSSGSSGSWWDIPHHLARYRSHLEYAGTLMVLVAAIIGLYLILTGRITMILVRINNNRNEDEVGISRPLQSSKIREWVPILLNDNNVLLLQDIIEYGRLLMLHDDPSVFGSHWDRYDKLIMGNDEDIGRYDSKLLEGKGNESVEFLFALEGSNGISHELDYKGGYEESNRLLSVANQLTWIIDVYTLLTNDKYERDKTILSRLRNARHRFLMKSHDMRSREIRTLRFDNPSRLLDREPRSFKLEYQYLDLLLKLKVWCRDKINDKSLPSPAFHWNEGLLRKGEDPEIDRSDPNYSCWYLTRIGNDLVQHNEFLIDIFEDIGTWRLKYTGKTYGKKVDILEDIRLFKIQIELLSRLVIYFCDDMRDSPDHRVIVRDLLGDYVPNIMDEYCEEITAVKGTLVDIKDSAESNDGIDSL